MDVIQERLEREYDLDLILTAPSVIYKVCLTSGEIFELSNPSELPDLTTVSRIEEPFVKAEIMMPKDYIGPVMQLCNFVRIEEVYIKILNILMKQE